MNMYMKHLTESCCRLINTHRVLDSRVGGSQMGGFLTWESSGIAANAAANAAAEVLDEVEVDEDVLLLIVLLRFS